MNLLKITAFSAFISIFSMTSFSDDLDVIIKIRDKKHQEADTEERVFPAYKTEKGLLDAYFEAWYKGDYELMYHLISERFREEMSFPEFTRLLNESKSVTGGVKGYDSISKIANNDGESEWSVIIRFMKKTAGTRNIKTKLIRDGAFWYIHSGGLLPTDMSQFDR
ncbi:MAG: hypothetical protein A2020_00300 [Lentisphaerae bacterium GWF2_45_14]|nr:MAG: hypothetical protein A2020_00300 [Lentisphaerae bacterium GWF2_45_14]